jgi:hypothetical protein
MIDIRQRIEDVKKRIDEVNASFPPPVVVDKEALKAQLAAALIDKRERPPPIEALTDREKGLLGAIADALKLTPIQKVALAKAALDNIKGSKP